MAQGTIDVHIQTPRDFGYTIGDTVRHEINLRLRAPYRLDATTLPKPGLVNHWLEILTVDVQEDEGNLVTSYRIVLDYQIFYGSPELKTLTIPQFKLLTTGGVSAIPVFIPDWQFTIHPVTNSASAGGLRVRSDRPPRPIPVFGRILRLMLCTLMLAALATYLFARQFLLPRLRQRRYPFTGALSRLRRLRQRDVPADDYRMALREFHTAVNSVAGKAVFAGNLDDFLTDNPAFSALAEELVAFFARSQDVFFRNGAVDEPAARLAELIDLCRRCSAIERIAT